LWGPASPPNLFWLRPRRRLVFSARSCCLRLRRSRARLPGRGRRHWVVPTSPPGGSGWLSLVDESRPQPWSLYRTRLAPPLRRLLVGFGVSRPSLLQFTMVRLPPRRVYPRRAETQSALVLGTLWFSSGCCRKLSDRPSCLPHYLQFTRHLSGRRAPPSFFRGGSLSCGQRAGLTGAILSYSSSTSLQITPPTDVFELAVDVTKQTQGGDTRMAYRSRAHRHPAHPPPPRAPHPGREKGE